MRRSLLITPLTLIAVPKCHAEETSPLKFTGLSQPFPLYPGEMTNAWHHIDIPAGPIAISEFSVDIVEQDSNGTFLAVPLSEAYLHHYFVSSGKDSSSTVGFGAGSESRGTRQAFPFPYRFLTAKKEDYFTANVHIINTRTMTQNKAHKCVDCPCTEQDYAIEKETKKHWFHWGTSSHKNKETNNLENRDITAPEQLSQDVIQRRQHWDRCNAQLLNESNTVCSPDTYHGGLLCCEDGEFCLDEYYLGESDLFDPDPQTHLRKANPNINERQSVFYLRYTITYQPLTRQNRTAVKALSLAECCDATGNLTSSGNLEYDVPKLCSDGTCVHTLSTIQQLHATRNSKHEEWVDVVYMVGHLNRGGIAVTAYFAENNTVLCQSKPRYGTGAIGEIGNEPGYINAMSACTFDPPRRMKTSDKLRIVGKYNASQAHTGAMSLFYVAIADVKNSHGEMLYPQESMSFFQRFQRFAATSAFIIVAVASAHVYKAQQTRRQGYEQIQSLVV